MKIKIEIETKYENDKNGDDTVEIALSNSAI